MRPEEPNTHNQQINNKDTQTHRVCHVACSHTRRYEANQITFTLQKVIVNAAKRIYQRHKKGGRLSHSFNSLLAVFFSPLWLLLPNHEVYGGGKAHWKEGELWLKELVLLKRTVNIISTVAATLCIICSCTKRAQTHKQQHTHLKHTSRRSIRQEAGVRQIQTARHKRVGHTQTYTKQHNKKKTVTGTEAPP